MSGAALDRLLAILVGTILLTGVLTWRAGSADTYWLYALHGLLSGALLVATLVKLRRSLPRGVGSSALVRAGNCPAAGRRDHRGAADRLRMDPAGGRYIEIGPWTLLGWHGIAGWAVLALVVVHLLARRRWRVLTPPAGRGRAIGRRSLLMGGSLAVAGLTVWGVAQLLDRLSVTPRRFTGSRWLPDGGIPPPTTFFGEGVPAVDLELWRLRVVGAVDRPMELALTDLRALATAEQEHILDCTGGWAMRTTWSGVPLSAVLDARRSFRHRR